MGWWQIYPAEQVCLLRSVKIPVSSQKGDMVNGDTPADIMGVAVDKIIKVYEKEWDRKPYRAELEAVLNFVTMPDMVEPEPDQRLLRAEKNTAS